MEYAILIGINAYRDRPLRGCVNDVLDMKTILDKQLQAIDVTIFTATINSSDVDQFGIVEDEKSWPTFLNVTRAIRQLKEKARAGDSVYIHYSGHGTCNAPDEDPNVDETNRYTGDLALALLDENDVGQVKLWPGSRLAGSINAMVSNGVTVTVVLDCCFSAAVYRHKDEPEVRYFPHNAKAGWKTGIEDDDEIKAIESEMRLVSMEPSWLVHPKGYSILAACGPHENAAEIKDRGEVYGKLSFFLCDLVKWYGLQRKQTRIYNHVRAKFWEHTGRYQQVPVLYGNKGQNFFGRPPQRAVLGHTKSETTETEVTVIPVVKSGHAGLQMLAGKAHGIDDEDEVVLYPSHVSDHSVSPIIVKVGKADAVTSILDLRNVESADIDSVSWVAEPKTRKSLYKFPVYLDPTLEHMDEWRASLSQVSIKEYDPNGGDPFHFHVRLRHDIDQDAGRYEILDASGQQFANMPPLDGHTEIKHVVAILKHLVKYQMVRELKNCDVLEQAVFQKDFDVFLTTRSGEKYQPGKLLHLREPTHKSYTFEIHVKNNSTRDLYVYFYALGPLWEVGHIHHATLEVVPPPSVIKEKHGMVFDPTFSRKLRTVAPEALRDAGIRECDDIVKVFVTSRPTSFDLLELPVVGLLRNDKSTTRSSQDAKKEPEQWAAFNFPIRTVFK